MNNYVLIMAGGSGTRLWPLSTKDCPKQFIDVLGVGKSLLQLTYQRSKQIVPEANIFIVAPEHFKKLILEQLPIKAEQILAEPFARNTAPCIYFASSIINSLNPDANILTLPADHLILNDAEFSNCMSKAFEFVSSNECIVTFGIKPSYAETGYGYIESDGQDNLFNRVHKFHEKPDFQQATIYLKSDNIYWNSGIFMWKNQFILDEFIHHSERIVDCFKNIDWSNYTKTEIEDSYSNCPNVSLDYEIMEKSKDIFIIKADFDWSDLGSWKSVYQNSPKDDHGNFLSKNITEINVKNCFVNISDQTKKWHLMDLENIMILESENNIVLAPLDSDQKIKELQQASNYKPQI